MSQHMMNQMRVRSFIEELDDGKDYSHILEAEKPVVIQQQEDLPLASPLPDNVNNEDRVRKSQPVEDVQYLFTNDQNVHHEYFNELEKMVEKQAELLGAEPMRVEESLPKSKFNTEVINVIDDESDNNNNIVIVDGYTLFVSNKWDRNQVAKKSEDAPASKPTNNTKATDAVDKNINVPSHSTRQAPPNLSLYDVIVVDDDDEYAYQSKVIEEISSSEEEDSAVPHRRDHVNSNRRHSGPQKANGALNGSNNVSRSNGVISSANNNAPKKNVNNNKSLFQFDDIVMDDD
jgi:heat shock protein HspQ